MTSSEWVRNTGLRYTLPRHREASRCNYVLSSSVAVYVPVLPCSAAAPQILCISYDVAFACKGSAGDETVDVTVLTVSIPSKDLNQAAQRHLQHAQEFSDDLHNLDMDMPLAWLSRGIPLLISDKGSSYE